MLLVVAMDPLLQALAHVNFEQLAFVQLPRQVKILMQAQAWLQERIFSLPEV